MKLAQFALAVLLVGRSASAEEPTPEEDRRACFHAVDEAQRLRIGHKLVTARDDFIQCARPVCPAVFRNDCVQWLSEVQATLPSVVFGARDATGQDLIDVQVFVDGKRTADKLEGTSSDIDPGPHVFRFEWRGRIVEQQAVIHEGEKARLIAASFPPWTPAGPASSHGGAPVPAGVWIFGAVTVAGVLGFGALLGSATGDVQHLRSTCAPTCAPSDVDSARTKATLGYASLGVGIASLGVATTWFVLSRSRGATAALSVGPTEGGAAARVSLSY